MDPKIIFADRNLGLKANSFQKVQKLENLFMLKGALAWIDFQVFGLFGNHWHEDYPLKFNF